MQLGESQRISQKASRLSYIGLVWVSSVPLFDCFVCLEYLALKMKYSTKNKEIAITLADRLLAINLHAVKFLYSGVDL